MVKFIRARVHPGKDDDLVDWLEAQPEGQRSEAIRRLMRDGLRMRQLEGNPSSMVRQAVAEALAGLQLNNIQRSSASDVNEIEEAFGDQLDQMLGKFG